MGPTDRQLVERVREGDREAFGDLVDRHRDMVYGLGYHLTHDFEAARDLAQEAFVQAYLKLGQLRDPDRFSGWLRQIATNVHRAHQRRKELTTVALEEAGEVPDTRRSSEIEVVVREGLARLCEAERLALTLHYINGYSHAEIGEFLGVRPETVKTRLARARQHLRTEVMAMVEESFEQNRLPEGFTQETVAAALARGQAALQDHDYQTALSAFGAAARMAPDSSEAHAGVGSAWLLKHEALDDAEAVAKARAAYEEALARDPRNEDALVALAWMEPDHRRAYERALAIVPESAELRYLLAWEIHASGETPRAVEMMTAMLAEDLPVSVRVRIHNNLGSWYHDSLGDPAKGREHLRLAAETAESSTTRGFAFLHWRVYARVALEDRQWAEASGAARHILEVVPSDFERRNLHVLLAVAAANLGRTEDAIAHLQEAATPGPERPGSGRWFWPYREPATDPLEGVRAHAREWLGPVAEDPRVQAILAVRE